MTDMWVRRKLDVIDRKLIEGVHISGTGHRGAMHIGTKVIGFNSPYENQWIISHEGTFTELDDLRAICAKVDAFIESELKRIEDESKPPWRNCTESEARANPHLSQFSPLGHHWQPMTMCPTNTPLMYQTRAPKPEPKQQEPVDLRGGIFVGQRFKFGDSQELVIEKLSSHPSRAKIDVTFGQKVIQKPEPKQPIYHDAGVHCPRCGSTKMRSGTVETDSGLEVAEHRPWTNPGKVEALQAGPIVTTANCQCICGASFESREEHWPEKKPEPKMPSVKPPEGTRWERWGGGKGLAISGDGIWCNLPDSKRDRDAMLACVAAYDSRFVYHVQPNLRNRRAGP